MKEQKYSGSEVRTILVGCICSTDVLSRIIPMSGDFESEFSNMIYSWCVDHYNKYQEAPGKIIEEIFSVWADESKDRSTITLIEKLLSSLSDEYEYKQEEIPNADFIIDTAKNYFDKIQVKKFYETGQGDIESGDYTKARTRILTFSPLEAEERGCLDVFSDPNVVRQLCERNKEESLISYPAGLGDFFGSSLSRGKLIGILGADKSGKSFLLLDMAFRSLCDRNRVAYFEAGDLGQHGVVGRLASRASRRPVKACRTLYPTSLSILGSEPAVEAEERVYESGLEFKQIWGAFQKLMSSKVKSKESYFKLHCSPNSTLTVDKIRSVLDKEKRKGWIPDVVAIDYADILSPPPGIPESRDQVNAIWKQLKALTQSHNCLVVTPTQANALAYKVRTLDRSNFSEDKRKNAHVDGMIGINSTSDERKHGLCRLNWIVRRDDIFDDQRYCYVAGCLAIANPSIISVF